MLKVSVKNITKSMEPVAALKEANKVIRREDKYKNLSQEDSKKILQDSEDWIFQRDPSDRYDYKNKRKKENLEMILILIPMIQTIYNI